MENTQNQPKLKLINSIAPILQDCDFVETMQFAPNENRTDWLFLGKFNFDYENYTIKITKEQKQNLDLLERWARLKITMRVARERFGYLLVLENFQVIPVVTKDNKPPL